jgi:ubiquinone/menaquinone biosynthesis C-methylase UbiE
MNIPRVVARTRPTSSYVAGGLEPATAGRDVDHRDFLEELVWRIFARNGLESLPSPLRFCSVGSGAGRWSMRMLDHCGRATGVAVHRTRESALATTRARDTKKYQSRLQVESSSGDALAGLSNAAFDVTFGLQHALDLADRPGVLMRELVRVTKPGGLVVVRVPHLAHAVHVNLTHGRLNEAQRALSGRAEIAPDTHERNLFTPQSVEQLMRSAGAEPRTTLGFPAVLSPWCPPTESAGLAALVAENASRATILSIEDDLLSLGERWPRGEELLAIATVRPSSNGWGDFWYTE